MKKFSLISILFSLLLIIASAGCSNNNSVILVEEARVNMEKADYLQCQIDYQFQQINPDNDQNISQRKVDRFTNKIFNDSNKAQNRIRIAINRTEEARTSTDDNQLRTFYDMKIHAYYLKREMAKRSSIYAFDIKKSADNKQKTKMIVTKYETERKRQQETYKLLINRAEDFMDLQRA